jgi:hypothetical protein
MTADDMMTDELTPNPCSLCEGEIDNHTDADGRVYWSYGHNAYPLSDGRCCDACNNYVIGARISLMQQPPEYAPAIIDQFLALCKEVVA